MVATDEDEIGGEERAEELTRDAWKRGISPKELWSTPIHQLIFVWYRQPDEISAPALEIITEQNQGKARPVFLANLLPEYRS